LPIVGIRVEADVINPTGAQVLQGALQQGARNPAPLPLPTHFNFSDMPDRIQDAANHHSNDLVLGPRNVP